MQPAHCSSPSNKLSSSSLQISALSVSPQGTTPVRVNHAAASRDAGCLVSGCRDSETSADASPAGDRTKVRFSTRCHVSWGETYR